MLDSPRPSLQASDKLWAFCLLCRVYFGDTHDLYTALLASLQIVCPLIQNLECVFAFSKKEGLLYSLPFEPCWGTRAGSKLRCALLGPLPLPMLLPHPTSLAFLKPWSPRPMIASQGSPTSGWRSSRLRLWSCGLSSKFLASVVVEVELVAVACSLL